MVKFEGLVEIDFLPSASMDAQFQLMNSLLLERTNSKDPSMFVEYFSNLRNSDRTTRIAILNKSFFSNNREERSQHCLKNKRFLKEQLRDNKIINFEDNLETALSQKYEYILIPQYISDSLSNDRLLDPNDGKYQVHIQSSFITNQSITKPHHIRTVNLHKKRVVEMLKKVLEKVKETREIEYKIFKIHGYERAIDTWMKLDESQFQDPMTIEQIVKTKGIGSSIGLKIMNCLSDSSQYEENNDVDNDDNNGNKSSWIESVLNKNNNTVQETEKIELKHYFSKLYGIGESKSSEYTEKIPLVKTITEIFTRHTEDVHIPLLYGWRYFNDFQARIPRDEVKYHYSIVQNVCSKHNVQCEVLGSFRRGQKQFIGDIDFLLFKRGENNALSLKKILQKIMQELITINYVDCILQGSQSYVHDYFEKDISDMINVVSKHVETTENTVFTEKLLQNLQQNSSDKLTRYKDSRKIFVGASIKNVDKQDLETGLKQQLDQECHEIHTTKQLLKPQDDIFQELNTKHMGNTGVGITRRVDFLMTRHSNVGAARLYFTGSNYFNRSCRILLKKKHNWKLTNEGLFDLTQSESPIVLKDCESEEEILKLIGLSQYTDPTTREINDYLKL